MSFEKLRSAFTKKQPSLQDGKAATSAESPDSNTLSNTPQVPDHKGQHGLILLNLDYAQSSAAESGATYDLDIVAIHGITGDAFKSWTHANQKHWLRDFLPDAFPRARIYTFGYPAEIFWSRSDGDIDSFARSLLEGLRRGKRSPEHKSRRIIFVCHSMGGIVAKKALTIARIDDDDYGEIRNSVSAILFLGTPHRGAGFASLLKLPMQITSRTSFPIISITGNTRKDLLKNLEKDARMLQEISKNFRNSMKDIKIASFVEKSTIPPLKKVIVDESTGTMGIPRERIVPMHGFNHSSMCRFDTVSNSGYISILEVLQDWAEETKENLKELSSADKSCLKSFAFPEMSYRRSDADKAHPKTCGWILQHESYKAWLVKERGLLWIKGKPGAGKSTLLAFVYRTFRGVLPKNAVLTLEFFFHGRGTALQKSSIGMFRSLLHQLYTHDYATRNMIQTAFREKEVFGEAGKGWKWNLSELQDLFFKCIFAAAKSQKLVIFIDALDESGSDAKDLVEYFHELNDELNEAKSKAAICISCRHYPVTAVIPGLDVLVEENNHGDIAHYVQAKLRMHTTKENNDGLQSKAWSEIEGQIVTNASGVFQWARLVVPMVLDHYEEGYTWTEIHEMLAKVPRELGAVYEHILIHVIKPERRQKTLHLMQLVFLAERPLKLEELVYAMAFDDDHISSSVRSYKDAERYINIYGGIYKLVNSLSGGLAEVKTHSHRNVVQFIHQSVNDYLISTGFQFVVSETAVATDSEIHHKGSRISTNEIIGQGHDRLSRSCVNYMRLALPEVSWTRVLKMAQGQVVEQPFIKYAARYWIEHARKAEEYGVSQEYLVQYFGSDGDLFKGWIKMCDIVFENNVARPQEGSSFLHIASGSNLRSVVKSLLNQDVYVEAEDGLGDTTLHYAARKGYTKIVEMLLEAKAVADAKNLAGITAIEEAAGNGHFEIVELLLQSGSNIKNALQAAAQAGSISLVKFLLNYGAAVNALGGKYGSALLAAAQEGHENIVRLLVSKGAKINMESAKHGSALQAAAAGGYESIVQFLLHNGADVNLQGGYYGNPLQGAIVGNNQAIIEAIMAQNADVNAPSGFFGTALQAAAHVGNIAILQLLLNSGAGVNTKNGHFGSPVQAACERGHLTCAELLLQNGADVNEKVGYHGNPLQAAASVGNLELVKLLLQNGAEISAHAGHFGNALQAAAFLGNLQIIELLLQNGADVNAEGGHYQTALQAAAAASHTETTKLLLEHGANPNIKGGEFGSAIQAAATQGSGFMCSSPVFVLLNHSVDVNIQGGKYPNALHAAIAEGDKITVAHLLRHGAILDPEDEEFSNALLAVARNSKLRAETMLEDRGYALREDVEFLVG